MSKNINLIIAVILIMFSACSTENAFDEAFPNNPGQPDNNQNGGGSASSDTSGDQLASFDINLDTSDLDEGGETIPTDSKDENYDDYVENSSFTSQITINFTDSNISVEGNADGVTVSNSGSHVIVNSTAKGIEYILKGSTSDGGIKIYSSNKFKLTLSGISITNKIGAAINIQSKKRIFFVCADGTTNSLTDGSSYTKTENEDEKGCIFSEGQLIFSGKGVLNVTGNYKHAICSDDYIRFRKGLQTNITANVSNGVKANDYIIINGGALNIDVKGDAAKGLSSDGYMLIDGGRTMILTSGSGVFEDNDVSGCAGVKCDSILTVSGGVLGVKSSGKGGKGISCDQDITINSGTVRIITTGTQYTYNRYYTSPKGIKSDKNITINGGNIMVRTSGGEGSEGIESKNILKINNGDVAVSAYDDCINASKDISINGGRVYAYSSGNDGIDSNGTITITGGTIVSSGTQIPEEGLDCDQNIFTITGGTIIGIGGGTSTPTESKCTQPVIIYGATGTSGNSVSLSDAKGNNILIYKIPRNYSQMTLLISSPSLSKGSSYTLSNGGTIKNGTEFYGLYLESTYTGGSSIATVSLSSMITTYGNVSFGPGGGGQHGGGQPGWGR